MNEATSLSSSMTRMRTVVTYPYTRRAPERTSSREPKEGPWLALSSSAAHEIAGLFARHLIDAVDRVAEAVDVDRIEFRVDAAAELRQSNHLRELEVVALEFELDEIRVERRRPNDDRFVVDDVPAMRPRQHHNAVDLLVDRTRGVDLGFGGGGETRGRSRRQSG